MPGGNAIRALDLSFVLILALLALDAVSVSAQDEGRPSIPLQIFEVQLEEGSEDVLLLHHTNIVSSPGWAGEVTFIYPFGSSRIFRSPEEILNWERKIAIETKGCQSTHTSDVSEEETVITVEILNASSEFDIFVRMELVGVVDEVNPTSFPMISRKGTLNRLSLVTSHVDLPVGRTRVVIHLPPEQTLANYLPTENVTVLRGVEDQQSVFWSFQAPLADDARVYLEFGEKGRMGRVMVLILVGVVMGAILAAIKLLLILDEESLTY